MHHFDYRQGEFHAEDVPISALAEAVGTPFYCYATATLTRHYQVFASAFEGLDALVCFAVKANSNQAVLATLARLGAGADVVSGGELARALAAGVAPGRIVFSGVGKMPDEMRAGLAAGIHQFNVESEPELRALSDVAMAMGLEAPVTIRVNPDVDAKTHEKISTGKAENKFGIPWGRARQVYREAAALPGIRIVGVDVHIGSQLTSLDPFAAAFARVADLVGALRDDGHDIARLDLGGGLGIPYGEGDILPPHPQDYGRLIAELAGGLGCQIILEPGRLIAGNAGILVTRVLYVKEGEDKRFVIVDAAMNDLVRPAMYDAYHQIVPVQASDADPQAFDIVGPVCETGDRFAQGRLLVPPKAGDLLAILSAGAYGAVMASCYNTRPLVPEVLVSGGAFAVVRPRPSVADLIAMDRMPDWLR